MAGASPSISRSTFAKFPRLRVGGIGAAILIIMLGACLGSLPWTMGRIGQPLAPGSAGGSATRSTESSQPRRFEAQDSQLSLLPPFWAHHTAEERQRVEKIARDRGSTPRPIFGTDRLGRDVFVRCLAGGAISLCVGLSAAVISVFIGTMWGTIAAARGGMTDAFMMRTVDVFFGLPTILLVVLLAVAVNGMMENVSAGSGEVSGSWLKQWWLARVHWMQNHKDVVNIVTLFVAIGGVSWLTMARVIRGQVLSLKAQPFMEACRAIGVSPLRQFTRHLLPNLLGPIIVYATLTVPTAILSESFLSFLGIGVREPLPSWGNLAATGLSELNIVRARWWLLLWPCLFIAVTLLALNFVGESLRERFDPKRS
jgi:oligopeptide transport system permease protein